MARYLSKSGSREQCLEFSKGTDRGTEGPWYHATNEQFAKDAASGRDHFKSPSGKLKEPVCFTRDIKGAAKDLANWEKDDWVIRASIHVVRAMRDQYDTDQGEFTGQHLWIKVWDARNIMVESGSARHRDTPVEEKAETD